MTDTILRLTTPNGAKVVVDGTKRPPAVTVVTDGNQLNFSLFAVRQSIEMGDYLDVGTAKVQVTPEDAVAVAALLKVSKRPRPLAIAGIAVAGALAVLYVIGLASHPSSSVAHPDSSSDTPDVAAQGAPTVAAIGSPVQLQSAALTVTRVLVRDSVGDAYIKERAADGGVLVVVETTVKNTGDKPIKSFDIPKIKLVDAAGTEYSPDAGKSGAYATEASIDMKAFSDLNPDISVTDADVFEVSKTRFDPATWYAEAPDGTKISLR